MSQSKPKYIETELGTEKLCICCDEYYPLDDEFFFHRKRKTKSGETKQYEAVCKACYPIHYNKQTSGRYSIKSNYEVTA
ncbi:hypothetical protein QR665_14720 [Acinetobacter gerneri]|uniref:hypothetical protein n=1 Tax=Acinetobacter gerneri TaxID=202952 RepID=UPI002935553B|nr:hypothetical protein [Acinetobacter gerneri]MDV2440713.1 hypothetical protein [Acinetobacter gerneri]